MTTQADVAAEAGCSVATVSRALAGDPRISRKTRDRVESAALRHGYRPRRVQRPPRAGGAIGLIVPSIRGRTSGYFEDASLVYETIAKEGYSLVLGCHENEPMTDLQLLRSMAANSVAGIVHVPCSAEGADAFRRDHPSIPVVELGARAASRSVDTVSPDDTSAISEIVSHLVELGHRRIAMFTGRSNLYHIQARVKPFWRNVETNGLRRRDCTVIFGPSTLSWERHEASRLLGQPDRPTAVIVANKPASIGVVMAARELGFAIPKDLSVIGYANEDWYEAMDPPLTSYEHPLREMGMLAAHMLIERLRGEPLQTEPARAVKVGGHIVIRASTGPLCAPR